MTAVQLNAEILRNLGAIAEDETMLKRVAKYLRKLVAERDNNDAEMTREEFLAKIEKGEEEYRQGKTHCINSTEELQSFIDSL